MNCGSDVSVDDRLDAFADASRRTVLATLSERAETGDSPAASIDTLASELASDGGRDESDGVADGGCVPDARSSFEDAKVELVHVHLPALERAALVERDGERVRLTAPDVVERGLELAEAFQ